MEGSSGRRVVAGCGSDPQAAVVGRKNLSLQERGAATHFIWERAGWPFVLIRCPRGRSEPRGCQSHGAIYIIVESLFVPI